MNTPDDRGSNTEADAYAHWRAHAPRPDRRIGVDGDEYDEASEVDR